MTDRYLREALSYAIDRQAIVDTIVKRNDPGAAVLNCGLRALPDTTWCQTQPFARFTYDPMRAKAILESDGYDCSSDPCTKVGKDLVVDYGFESCGYDRRAETFDVLQAKALSAGIGLRLRLHERTGPFGCLSGPVGFPGIEDAAIDFEPNPSVTDIFGCATIRAQENHYAGNNRTRWCNPVASQLMEQSDRELDPAKRLDLLNQVYAMEAEDAVALPLYVLPVVSAWRTDAIAGPIGVWNSSPYGLFFNINEWYLVS